MAWIWEKDKCPDKYGQCIRQYVIFSICALIVILCLYSIIQIIRKLSKYKFEMIPLTLNAIASISMLGIFSQLQVFNTHLIMLVLEIYSYSLLSYAYIGIYLRSSSTISVNTIKRWRYSFIAFSFFVFVGIGVVIYLSAANKIKCQQQHGLGTLILFIIEIPIYIVTTIFIVKTKRKIKQLQEHHEISEQEHLLQNQDQYIKIRYRQANFTLVCFTLSLILHVVTLGLFQFGSEIKCNDQGYFKVENGLQICILVIEDIAEMIPHLCMPIVFFFIPQKFHTNNPSIAIVPNKIHKSMNSNLISNYEKQNIIRDKYQHKS